MFKLYFHLFKGEKMAQYCAENLICPLQTTIHLSIQQEPQQKQMPADGIILHKIN